MEGQDWRTWLLPVAGVAGAALLKIVEKAAARFAYVWKPRHLREREAKRDTGRLKVMEAEAALKVAQARKTEVNGYRELLADVRRYQEILEGTVALQGKQMEELRAEIEELKAKNEEFDDAREHAIEALEACQRTAKALQEELQAEREARRLAEDARERAEERAEEAEGRLLQFEGGRIGA